MFESLNIPALLGCEVLEKVEMRLIKGHYVSLSSLIANATLYVYNMSLDKVVIITTTENQNKVVTVVSMKLDHTVLINHQSLVVGDYLITPILPLTKFVRQPPNDFDTWLVHSSEL